MNAEGLKEMLSSSEVSTVIGELKNGRYTSVPNVDPYKAELDPSLHKVMDHGLRPDKLVKVGYDENIDTDDETLIVNGDGSRSATKIVPVERISLSLQRLIVERAVSFLFGNPLSVTADVEQDSKESEVFKAIKAVLRDAKTSSADRKVARTLLSATEVAEHWYPVQKSTNAYGFSSDFKLRMSIFSPLKGDTLYPYFDEWGDMIAFSREYTIEQNDNKQHTFFETWTAEMHYKWVSGKGVWTMVEGYPIANPIGKIPVIYGRQEEVEWKVVQNLIERLEVLLSNFADTNDYHASPKIFITGQIRGFAKKGESGAVIEGEDGATANYLSWNQAPEAIKLEIDTLLKMIYSLTQTPDISFDSVKGLNVSGVSLKMLFMDAHLKVKDKTEIFDEYMQRRMSVIQSYLALMNARDTEFARACNNLLVDVEIIPFMIEDDNSTISTLMAATGQKAVMSQRTAIQSLGWVNDPDAEWERINEENSMMSMGDMMGQEPMM